MNNIKNQFVKLSNILKQKTQIPLINYDTDIFLIAYPKSGITWMRFLIANVISEAEVDFHNLDSIIPVIGQNELISALDSPKFIKTHELYNPNITKGIYIVRDGRDVYVSYYYYRLKDLPPDTSFSKFLTDKNHWPSSWRDHIFSWLPVADIPNNLLLIRYEDLLSSPLKELRKICIFVNIDIPEEKLIASVKASDFNSMKRLENEKGRSDERSKGITLVRKGKKGDWRNTFSEADISYFKEFEGDALISLGYEQDNNW